MARIGALIIGLVGHLPMAIADPIASEPAPSTRGLGANPDLPAFEVGMRRGLRGKTGGTLPIWHQGAGHAGAFVNAEAFIELHNDVGGFVPHEMWRGHMALCGGYALDVRDGLMTLALAAEHESDHVTNAPAWIYYNSASFAGRYERTLGPLAWSAGVGVRRHLGTCTISDEACTGKEPYGDPSWQFTADTTLAYHWRSWGAAASGWSSKTMAHQRVAAADTATLALLAFARTRRGT